MRIIFILISILFIPFFACKKIYEPIRNYTYIEGKQIPNTKVFLPLGSNPGGDPAARPKISPDGTSIVYKQFHPDSTEPVGLYILDLSTFEKRLLKQGISARNPDWSPEGNWIVFNEGVQIFKIKVNGDSLTQMTTQGRNFFPDWSPDGQWIAYDRSLADSAGPAGVWIMRNNGSDRKWIGKGRYPIWLNSNDMIICTINEPQFWQLIIYSILDSVSNRLPFKSEDIRDIDYSIKRNQIVLWTSDGIWIVDAENMKPKRILPSNLYSNSPDIENRLFVFAPSWHPDGKHIVYEHYRATRIEYNNVNGLIAEGYYSLYLVDVDQALAVSNLP